MSSTNVPNPLPLFNNNKSLYGSRTQTNQSSKKISIIEDKTTLEPVRSSPLSPIIPSTNLNINAQRSIPITNPSTSSEFSSSHIQKQIHIQKQALHLFDLEQVHDNIQQQLDDWKHSMYNQVQSMKIHMLKQN
ncbi:unnamed protein product, partial [Adineta steineri]